MKPKNDLLDMAKQFKKLGNRKFTKSPDWNSIVRLTKSLSTNPNDPDLLSKRALSHLNLGCYEKSLSDCEHSLLINPVHEKSLLLKIKSFWGLQRYEEALNFLENNLILKQNPKEFEILKQKCHKMLQQSRGFFNIQELMSLPKNKCNEIGEFTGPLEISEIPGKGRGLIATQNIHPGQLLMCSKAFSLVLDDDIKVKGHTPGSNNRDYFLSMICQKLILEPSLRPLFFGLYPSPPPQRDSNNPIDYPLDVELIDSVIKYNSFAGDEDPWPWADGTPNFWGLWILPSYINHSCMDCNSYYYFYGDIMLIRAVKFIPQGTEVTITYTPPTNRARRKEIMEMHNFKCSCQLCLMELQENPEVEIEIEKTLELIRGGLTLTSSQDLNSQVGRIEKLSLLRPLYPTTNMALLDPCLEMVCSQLAHKEEWRVFADLFEKSHSVTENNCYVINAVNISIVMLQCYVHLKEEGMIRKWIGQLKLDLVTAYGSIEALRCIKCKIVKTLETAGFNFFED